MDKLITIAIADDHLMMRHALAGLLNVLGGMQVVIEASDGKELIDLINNEKIKPDICIVDINMKGMNGFDTVIELKKRWPDIGILVLTQYSSEHYIIRMITYGANGYLFKGGHQDELKNAIYSIHINGYYYSEQVSGSFIHSIQSGKLSLPHITAKETELLKLCGSDLTYAEIAAKLNTTSRAVEGYRDSLFKKLGMTSRVSLALYAISSGIVLPD